MQTFATPGKTRVVVNNPLGSVEVRAVGTGETTVELLGRGGDADALLEDATVTCTDAGGTSVVTITFPSPRSFLRRTSIDVSITAPERSDVSVTMQRAESSLLALARGGSGDVRLLGTFGDVDVSLPSADVTAQVVDGTFRVQTVSGDVNVQAVNGAAKVRSVSGDVRIDRAGDDVSVTLVSGDVEVGSASREVDVTSVSGDLTVGDAHDGVSAKSTSGDVEVRRVLRGTVRCHTVSGDISVGVAAGRTLQVDARSMSGDLRSDIDLDARGEGDGERADVVRITANSMSGDVHITRAPAPTGA